MYILFLCIYKNDGNIICVYIVYLALSTSSVIENNNQFNENTSQSMAHWQRIVNIEVEHTGVKGANFRRFQRMLKEANGDDDDDIGVPLLRAKSQNVKSNNRHKVHQLANDDKQLNVCYIDITKYINYICIYIFILFLE